MSTKQLSFYTNDLPEQLDNLALMAQLISQLEKDLGVEEIDKTLKNRLHLTDLSFWLRNYVQQQLENKSEDFFNSLYVIDIEDKMLKIAFGSDQPYESLAELIIKRELYKVIVRQKFKSDQA